MKSKYLIEGMTCNACVAKMEKIAGDVQGIVSARIGLDKPQAELEVNQHFNEEEWNKAVTDAGPYRISRFDGISDPQKYENIGTLRTYRPLLMIIGFIAGVSLLNQFPFDNFHLMVWMRHFMAGFFIVFAFFKLLNPKSFALAYRRYDLVAAKWKAWGWIYPYIELTLGIFYLLNLFPVITPIATIVVLGVSSVGVIRSTLSKQNIQCACLGETFNLPLSSVTIIEDLGMVGMALIILTNQII